jgi:hypothetical protein
MSKKEEVQNNDQKGLTKEEKMEKINLLLDKLESSISKLEKKQPKSVENILSKTNEYWENNYKMLMDLQNKSKEINSQSLMELTDIIMQCLCFQQDLLTLCCSFQKPDERGMNVIFSRFKILIKPINKLASSNTAIALQANCVENGLNVLCWLFNDYECDIIAKTYYESIDIPLNQIMIKKNKGEIEWFKIFKNLLKMVVNFVEQNNKNGLNWKSRGNNEINELILELGSTYRNNFFTHNQKDENESKLELEKLNENINKIRIAVESGEIQKKLKPVKKVESTAIKEEDEENQENQKEKMNFSSSTFFHPGVQKSFAPKDKKENYEENNNSIVFENYVDLNKCIEPEKLKIGTFLKIVNCVNCTFNINKRINKILILNCENCNVSCGELITDIEMINCSKIRVICGGIVNLAIVYRSKDIVFFLNSISKNLRVRRSFSSHIMLKINKEQTEEFKETVDILLPEQFVFRINDDKKLEINYISF